MKKVLVLMSGGIDSSVAAALLKSEGFEVTGAFMKLADLPRFKEGEKRAKNVAKVLKIPFLVSDLRKEFKKKIIDYFLDGYKKGITPNPCVLCNKEIKFGLLLEKALALDADFIATGHYARKKEELNFSTGVEKVNYMLLKGRDENRDQSYFLWMLNQKRLKRILFPIGDYTRKEVENLARKFKLPVLKAKKSVEICFIEKTVNDFLKKYLKEKPGLIVEEISITEDKKYSNMGPSRRLGGWWAGCSLQNVRISWRFKILGKHQGLAFYTIGQRKGIGLPGGPYFVLDKDLKRNLLIVTKNEKDLYKKELICKNVNWISGIKPKLPLRIKAKIRYRHQPTTATITKILNSKFYILKFARPQRAITSGQSVVFYKGQEVLGGGIIKNKEILC